jgi:transcriptional regulator with GAF, ATPase, and Fis domain
LDWLNAKHHAELYGKPIEMLVGLDMNQLELLACRPEHARPLPRRDFGLLCYGVLQAPLAGSQCVTSIGQARTRADNALVRAECDTLREVLQRCNWNVSLAATQLNISRRTLHRKLKAHGLRRYSVTLNRRCVTTDSGL